MMTTSSEARRYDNFFEVEKTFLAELVNKY